MRPNLLKTVSKRKFSFTTESRIEELKKIRLKKQTEAKVNWAVTAYTDWRNERLYNYNYDVGIYGADLHNLKELTIENLHHALCRFIPEVTKVKGDGPFPGKTLYQMVVAIQKYLHINRIMWHLVDSLDFLDLQTVLDNVMQERAAMNIGMKKKQAQVISYKTESELWEKGLLGEDSPDKLRDTVLFLLGINLYLRAIEDHYNLRRDTPDEKSQISLEKNENGQECVVYREDCVTKTHDGGFE